MPVTVLLPALSPTMEKGNLVKWLKQEGEKVCSGDVVAEVETDKATMEVECFDDGIIGKLLVSAGSKNVQVNTPIAIILLEGEKQIPDDFDPMHNIISSTPSNKETVDKSTAKPAEHHTKDGIPINVAHNNKSRIKSTPLARRIAKQSNIDLSRIIGSGPSGRIIKNDVLSALECSSTSNQATKGQIHRAELSSMRAMIAERLSYSKQTIPHYYLTVDCNIDSLLDLRQKINEDLTEKTTINDFIVKAAALSLKKHPEVNCSWDDTHVLKYSSIDVAVAVALKGGLVTPIIRETDEKSITEISKEIRIMAEKAKSGILSKEEYQGGSITVSNLGMYDIKEFIAIINPPQSSILAIGKAEKRPIVVANEIKIATIMTVTLSADHRLVDGAMGAEFVRSFKNFIEKPLSMLVY